MRIFITMFILLSGLLFVAFGQNVTEEWIILNTDANAPAWMSAQDARGIDYNGASVWKNIGAPTVGEMGYWRSGDEGSPAWMATSNARGVDINLASSNGGKTIVVADNGNNTVQVIDPNTGLYLWSLDTTGVGPVFTGHTVSPYRVAATSDGQIFVNSFDGIVVRWANDADSTQPEIVADLSADATYTGNSRALEVVGSGTDVRLFLGKGLHIVVFDSDAEGNMVLDSARTIVTGWANECEAIATEDSNLVYAANADGAADQTVNRRVYELTPDGYVNNEALVAQLPYTAWFVVQGLDVLGDYYIMTEAGGGKDGFAVGTITGANFSPLTGDTDGDNVYDAGMNSPSLCTDICIDPETMNVYWTSAGTDTSSGIGGIHINAFYGANTIVIADDDNNAVHLHSAADGSFVYDLPNDGLPEDIWTSSAVAPYRVAASDDGQIFANTFNGIVARWENDAAYPGIAIDLSGETGNSRALEVVGSGANTTVFVGKGTDIRTFEGDGEGGFTENTARRINAVFADEVDAIAAENADTLWVANNASAAGSRLVYVWNGAAYVADAAAAAALPFKAFVAQGLAVDPADQLYMLAEAGGAMDGIAVGLFDGTNLPPEPSSLDSDGDGVYDAAGRINSASLVTDVAVDRANNTVYWTSAGGSGGIGLLKVNFPQFPLMTFAEARVDDNGDFMPDMLNDTVRVVGVITSPNYQSGSRSEHYFQDATAGLDLYFSGGNLGLNIGDEVEVVGVMAQYNGLAEIVPLSTGDVTVLSSGNSVVPVVITPAELNEDVEGQLVRMDSVWLTDPSAWPAEGSNRSVYFTDGIDTVMMYVDRDTDLDGWVPPQGLMNLISVAGQFSTATPPNDGYQIRGTLQEHFIDLSPEVALDPDSLGFGEMAINGHHTLMVKFKNMGTTPVVIDSIRFGTEYFSSAMADSAIAGQDSADIPVTFSPMMTDPVEDVMTIHTPVASFEVVVTGSGYELFPLVWRMHADSTGSEWFFTEAAQHMVRNIAYNPVSRHLLVASRVGGSKVWAIDQATGDTVKSLNTSIITGGGYYINLLACTEDGQIIVGNLAYSSGQPFKLYYYADEDADPVVAYDGTFDVFGARVGDALAVSGSGNDVKVYVSGSGNSNVNVLTLSDGVATRGTDIALPEASAARYGIAPVAHGDYIFTNGPGITPRYIKADGTVLHEFDTAVIPSGTNVTYFEVPTNSGRTRHFIGITNGYSSGTSVVELLGTPGDELCSSYNLLAAPTENYATNGNANATGAAVYNTGLNSLVEMITNNGISSYDFSVVEGDAITAILNTDNIIPEVYSLSQNYPNPFNPTTSVDVSLPKTGLVKILIYNILGQEVMSVFNGQLTAGNHSFMIDASSLSSGVYVYRIQADGFTAAKKMVLMK